jgi:hypothetical protein
MYNCINIELWKRACHKMRDCIYKRSVRSWTTTKTSFYTKQTVRQLYMLCRLYYTTCSVIVYIRRTLPANNFLSATHEDTQPASSSKTHQNTSFETQSRMRLKSEIIQSPVAYILIIIPFTHCDWEYTSSLLTRCRFDDGCWTPSLFGWNG